MVSWRGTTRTRADPSEVVVPASVALDGYRVALLRMLATKAGG
jgi:hypothetical protein